MSAVRTEVQSQIKDVTLSCRCFAKSPVMAIVAFTSAVSVRALVALVARTLGARTFATTTFVLTTVVLTACAPSQEGIAGEQSTEASHNQAVINNPDASQRQHREMSEDLLPPSVTPIYFQTESLSATAVHGAEIATVFTCSREQGGQLLSVDSQGNVSLWQLRKSKPYRLYQLGFTPYLVKISADCKYLAASIRNRVLVVDLQKRREMISFDRMRQRITSLSWTVQSAQSAASSNLASDTQLLFGTSDGGLFMWRFLEPDLGPAKPNLERYLGHSSVVSAIAMHEYGRAFFSADWSGGLSAWLRFDADPYAGKYDKNIFGDQFFSDTASRVRAARGIEAGNIERIVVTKEFLLAGTQSGEIELWNLRGLTKSFSAKAHQGLLHDLAASPDGKTVVSIGRDSQLKVFEIVRVEAEDKTIGSELKLISEQDIDGGRSLSFLNQDYIYIGDASGRILEVNLKKVKASNGRAGNE